MIDCSVPKAQLQLDTYNRSTFKNSIINMKKYFALAYDFSLRGLTHPDNITNICSVVEMPAPNACSLYLVRDMASAEFLGMMWLRLPMRVPNEWLQSNDLPVPTYAVHSTPKSPHGLLPTPPPRVSRHWAEPK